MRANLRLHIQIVHLHVVKKKKIVVSILILARTINAQAIIHSDLILYECQVSSLI